MLKNMRLVSVAALLGLVACSGEESVFQGKNARLKSDSTAMEPATVPVNVAGANLVFECRIVDLIQGDQLTGLECSFADLNHKPVVATISYSSVEKAFAGASGATSIAFTTKGTPLTLVIPNLSIPEFSKGGQIVVHSKVDGVDQVSIVELIVLNAQAIAADTPVPAAATPPGALPVTPTSTSAVTPTATSTPATAVPVPTPHSTASLYGQWAGLCGFDSGNGSCNLMTVGKAINNGSCAAGFVFQEVASRFQGAREDAALNDRRMGACLRNESSPIDAEIRANPADFAVAKNWYGVCYYSVTWTGSSNRESSSCDGGSMYPMNSNKTCPAGFSFTHIAGQRGENNSKWVATCVANVTGSRAEPAPSSAIQGFCVYDFNGNSCKYKQLGSAQSRNNCANGDVFRAFNARFEGVNEKWSGVCVKP